MRKLRKKDKRGDRYGKGTNNINSRRGKGVPYFDLEVIISGCKNLPQNKREDVISTITNISLSQRDSRDSDKMIFGRRFSEQQYDNAVNNFYRAIIVVEQLVQDLNYELSIER